MRTSFIIVCGFASAASCLVCGVVLLGRVWRENSSGLDMCGAGCWLGGVALAVVVAGVIGVGIAALLSRPRGGLARSTGALWFVGLVVSVGLIPAGVGILYAGSRILYVIGMRPSVAASKDFERAGLPLYPNATVTGSSLGAGASEVSLSTRDSATEVVAFYETHLDRSWVRDSRWEFPHYVRPGGTSELQKIEIESYAGSTSVRLYQCTTEQHLIDTTDVFSSLLNAESDDQAFRLLSPRMASFFTNSRGLRAYFDQREINFHHGTPASACRRYIGAGNAYVEQGAARADPKMPQAYTLVTLRVYCVKLGGLWWIDGLDVRPGS